ncbi:MFS transporter [Escherichia coli]|nr:MFS transporter [Escherichia coli]
MKNPYYPTALGLYFNYLVHGMGVILMSLNMASLETLWQTNAAGVSIVISSLGIGRLSVLLFAGLLSDRFGRRPFIMLGMCCYMAFFFGILHTNNIIIAYVFGFLAGMANSFLDAGIMFINALFLYRCTFPPHPGHRLPVIKKTTSSTEHRCSIIDLASYTLYGYISMATFYLVSQWLAQYGQFVAGMSYTMSIKLLSIYTVGSLLCVFITAPLIRNTVRPTTLLMLYTFISFIALFTVCLHPTFYVVIIFAFVIGFTSAGGVVQIGLTLMAERFPYAKGKATGIYYSAGSIATFTIPLITAHLSQRSIADIMWFDTAIAAIGFLLALFIGLRSRKKTRHHSLKENVAPGG